MKKLLSITVLVLLLAQTGIAQNKFSIGLVGTRFENTNDNHNLTNAENPLGYGMIVGYSLNENVTFALTGEYFKDDMEKIEGTEKDFRAHLSTYIIPVTFDRFRPYVSAGLVYTNRKLEYNGLKSNETKDVFNGRIGAGIDYLFLDFVGLNVDFGFYNDGWNFVGWSSSVGLRYVLN